jgi:lipopolysaccharide biosynthesis protein/glycosyltransferase involved in cell wall biosynthesis
VTSRGLRFAWRLFTKLYPRASIEAQARLIFDSEWYFNTYPMVRSEASDAYDHYAKKGFLEGKEPHRLFDTPWYLKQISMTKPLTVNPLYHYCSVGFKEGLDPTVYFDTGWYLETNKDVRESGMNPFLHFIRHGAQEGRNPNRFFDAPWYLAQLPSSQHAHTNPLIHYLQFGEALGIKPSPRFDPRWYLDVNPDVARARMSPLQHFLTYGQKEGRHPSPPFHEVRDVAAARIVCPKAPQISKAMALLVTHSPDGTLKPHVPHYIESLAKQGIATILIVAADAPFAVEPTDLKEVAGLFIRRNEGFDFAAWAHILRLHPTLYDIDSLLMANDSVIGPFNDRMFSRTIDEIRQSDVEVIGLTDSYENCWHIQSYFLFFKKTALRSQRLRDFFSAIVSHSTKIRVIHSYELELSRVLMDGGLKCGALFPTDSTLNNNSTIYRWHSLIDAGFPFVKVTTIRDPYPGLHVSGWRRVLKANGYDPTIADAAVAASKITAATGGNTNCPLLKQGELQQIDSGRNSRFDRGPAAQATPATTARSLPRVEFSAEFYLLAYPDIATAGVDPYKHYTDHGRAEGRLPELAGLEALDQHALTLKKRETILIVSHEGVRGGAPILSYNIVSRMLKEYNVTVLFLGGGPIMDECRKIGAVVIGPISLRDNEPLAKYVVKRMLDVAPMRFAIINTIESRFVLSALAQRYVPTVTLIHEFAAYIRPRGAFHDTALWSNQTVFSTEITRDNAIFEYPELGEKQFPIVPQGLCVVPKPKSATELESEERVKIARLLRPTGYAVEGLIVLGAGLVEYRKGVDLFLDCAKRIRQSAPEIPVRFVWMGRGFDPTNDTSYSAYLQDQMRRAGLDQDVVFLEVFDVNLVYSQADLFLLTSRLDPLPNVGVEALSAGIPVLCFDRTTGIANILNRYEIGKDTVANYLATEDMALKAVALLRSKERRASVAQQVRQIAQHVFDMSEYIQSIKSLAADASTQQDQEKHDVAAILTAEVIKGLYHESATAKNYADTVRKYVRSWASGVGRQKLFAGFHPGIYAESHGLSGKDGDPLAQYLRAGQPKGPWRVEVIDGKEQPLLREMKSARVALHIHAYYPSLFAEIISRLKRNSIRPDLLISVTTKADRDTLIEAIQDYPCDQKIVRVVPNIGRDLAPLFTEFARELQDNYDFIGHVHTKKTTHISDRRVGEKWYLFLLENLLGGNGRLADVIIRQMQEDNRIGMIFPDDPHVVGWAKNKEFAKPMWDMISRRELPEHFWFPIGSMFWARASALKPLFELRLELNDYPKEPVPFDGTMLHAMERLLGLVVLETGHEIRTTHLRGISR